MLYNTKWEAKADPFTLESLIAWAEKQPADERYEFFCNQCYLGQYFEAHGYQIKSIGVATVTFADGRTLYLPRYFNAIAEAKPHTFGAALDRALAFLAISTGEGKR